jgi:hypothetical protein
MCSAYMSFLHTLPLSPAVYTIHTCNTTKVHDKIHVGRDLGLGIMIEREVERCMWLYVEIHKVHKTH